MKLKKNFSKNIVFVLAIIFTSFFCFNFNSIIKAQQIEVSGDSADAYIPPGCGFFAGPSYDNQLQIYRITLIDSNQQKKIGQSKDIFINQPDGDSATKTKFDVLIGLLNQVSQQSGSITYCNGSKYPDSSMGCATYANRQSEKEFLEKRGLVNFGYYKDNFLFDEDIPLTFMSVGANSSVFLKSLLLNEINLKKNKDNQISIMFYNELLNVMGIKDDEIDKDNSYFLIEPVFVNVVFDEPIPNTQGACIRKNPRLYIGTLQNFVNISNGADDYSSFIPLEYGEAMFKNLYITSYSDSEKVSPFVPFDDDVSEIKKNSSLLEYAKSHETTLFSTAIFRVSDVVSITCDSKKQLGGCIRKIDISTNKDKSCYLNSGIAYDDVSSENTEIGNGVYCYESIESNFPISPTGSFQIFKSGSLFNISKNSETYGSIIITRHCETKDGKTFRLGDILKRLIDDNGDLGIIKPSVTIRFGSSEYQLKQNGVIGFVNGNEGESVSSGTGKVIIKYSYPLFYVKKDGVSFQNNNCLGCSKFGFGFPIKINEPTGEKNFYISYTISDTRGGLFNDISSGPNLCSYKVDNEIIDTGKNIDINDDKINIEFRIIDTKYPFVNGSGLSGGTKRNVGTNWQSDSDTTPDNEIVQKYIKEANNSFNKNKTGAMYSITLTPTDIKEIRNYNKKNKYDDYKLECNNEGNNCISGFISDYVYKNKITGLCTTDKFRAAGLPDDIFNNKCLK